MYFNLFTCQILENDEFSQIICNHCWYTIEEFHKFYNKIELAQTNLWTKKSQFKTETNHTVKNEGEQSFENSQLPLYVTCDLKDTLNTEENKDVEPHSKWKDEQNNESDSQENYSANDSSEEDNGKAMRIVY